MLGRKPRCRAPNLLLAACMSASRRLILVGVSPRNASLPMAATQCLSLVGSVPPHATVASPQPCFRRFAPLYL